MWKILVVLLCLSALILLVVMICDSNRFVKVSYRISDRRLKKNCRVVLLADLHNKSYGKHNEKLLAAIKSSTPDLILCAGDLITSRSGKSMEHAKELVRAISAEYPLCKRQSRIPDLSGTANLWENGGILSCVFKRKPCADS